MKLADSINAYFPPESAGNVFHAHVSPDGSELYYTMVDYTYEDDIYVARYNKETDVWDSVTRLSVNTNNVRRELSPSITADHSKLFWCSWNRGGGYGSYDVWYAEWDSAANDWGTPSNAGPNVNTPGAEFTCFVAPDGKTLYVQSDYDSDVDDIYKHIWQDTCWGPRERVFENIHPFGAQYDPWVSADGVWIYFSQWSSDSYGQRSTWRARWQGEYFGTPEWVGPPVSLPGEWQFNDGPSLNAQGSRMYFSSNRPDSNSQGQYIWHSEYLYDVKEKEYANQISLTVMPISKGSQSINYALLQSTQVFCCILDTDGNLIKILASETQSPGNHLYIWNGVDDRGRAVANGTYLVQLTADRSKVVKKTINLRKRREV